MVGVGRAAGGSVLEEGHDAETERLGSPCWLATVGVCSHVLGQLGSEKERVSRSGQPWSSAVRSQGWLRLSAAGVSCFFGLFFSAFFFSSAPSTFPFAMRR